MSKTNFESALSATPQPSLNHRTPRLPRLLSLPLSVLPGTVHTAVFTRLANAMFSASIAQGDLGFLRNKTVLIKVNDADVEMALTLAEKGLATSPAGTGHDLSIQGDLYDLLLLITRREDSDTLFFQRRLRMEGDTELGLHVKNFLDGLDVESLTLYRPLHALLNRFLPIYARLFS